MIKNKKDISIPFGKYRGVPINEVPTEYLIWIFSKLYSRPVQRTLYKAILEYFLKRDIRVNGGNFYFNDFKNLDINEVEQPFLICEILQNSKGDNVYLAGSEQEYIYIEKVGDHYKIIENKYYDYIYKFGGKKLIFEVNRSYSSEDNKGFILKNAFLMRQPYIPPDVNIHFSINKKSK